MKQLERLPGSSKPKRHTNQLQGGEQNPTIIFLHIPKTAGQTIGFIARRQYEPGRFYNIGHPPEREVEKYKLLDRDSKVKFKFVKGHVPFGLHMFVPGPSTYVTFLRNPIERVISLYYYLRRLPDHPLYHAVHQLTLEDFVIAKRTIDTNNGQTRYLCGAENALSIDLATGQELLDRAISNLETYFACWGITEKFDQSILLWKKKLNWRMPFYIPHNITRQRPPREAISKGTIQTIADYNHLDVELYKFAVQRFENWTATRNLPFQAQLFIFKTMNVLFRRKPNGRG